MGNIFSCIRPKNARLIKAQHKRRKHKNSKLQKIFENTEVRSCLDVEETHWEIGCERKAFDEEKWEVQEFDDDEEIKEKNDKDEVEKKQQQKQEGDEEMIQDFGVSHSEDQETRLETGDDCSQKVISGEDYDIYQAGDHEPEPEPVKKIYHYKAENWTHFNAALEQEYREQYEDDLASILDQYTSEANEYVAEMLDVVLDRVKDVVDYRKMMSETEEDRWTPPLVEGEIYIGSGILKKNVNTNENHKRNITWALDVKPPSSEMIILGNTLV